MKEIGTIFALALVAVPVDLRAEETRFDMLLNMVHDNPGEAVWVTDFKDPRHLRSLGYTGMVPKFEPQCGLTYDAYAPGIVPQQSEERIWIERKAAENPDCPTLYQIRCSVPHYVSAPLFGSLLDRLRTQSR